MLRAEERLRRLRSNQAGSRKSAETNRRLQPGLGGSTAPLIMSRIVHSPEQSSRWVRVTRLRKRVSLRYYRKLRRRSEALVLELVRHRQLKRVLARRKVRKRQLFLYGDKERGGVRYGSQAFGLTHDR